MGDQTGRLAAIQRAGRFKLISRLFEACQILIKVAQDHVCLDMVGLNGYGRLQGVEGQIPVVLGFVQAGYCQVRAWVAAVQEDCRLIPLQRLFRFPQVEIYIPDIQIALWCKGWDVQGLLVYFKSFGVSPLPPVKITQVLVVFWIPGRDRNGSSEIRLRFRDIALGFFLERQRGDRLA